MSRAIQDRPWAVILLTIAITVGLGLGLLRLHGEVTYESLLPKEFPSIEALDHVREDLGGVSFETVLIEAPTITDPEIVELLIGLEDYVNEDPRFNQGQIVTMPGEESEDAAEILKQPIPFIQHYLSPMIPEMKKELAESELGRLFGAKLSNLDDATVSAMMGMSLQELVEGLYLSEPSVWDSMVLKQKFIAPVSKDTGEIVNDATLEDYKAGKYDLKAAKIIIKVPYDLSEEEQISLANDLDDFFHERLRGIEGAEVYIAGDPTLARDFNEHIKNKTLLLFAVAMALVIIVLLISFRRLSDTILPVLFMFIGLVWTFGLMGWLNIPYSIASIAIMPILLGTALTFVVPFIARYYEEVEQDIRSVAAVGKALMTVGVAIFLAAITNFFGFMVFEFNVLPTLREFGLTCGIGTIFIFLLSISILPAIMVIRDRVFEKRLAKKGEVRKTHFDGLSRRKRRGLFARSTDHVLRWFSGLSINRSTWVIIIFTLLIILGFTQMRSLTTDSDLRTLVPRGLPGIEADYEIDRYFGGFQDDFILIHGDVLAPENLQLMLDLENRIAEDPDNEFGEEELYSRDNIYGISDALRDAYIALQGENGGAGDTNNGVLPATREEVRRSLDYVEDNYGFIYGSLLSFDEESALITLMGHGAPTAEIIDRKIEVINDNCEEVLGGSGLEHELGGITPLTKDITKNIIPTQTVSSILSLALCAIILIIMFRSFPYGLITLTVALAGVAAEIGFLSLMNWPLDFITSLVSALVIGVGVNFGILFTHRYSQEIELEKKKPMEAIQSTMMNLGRANVIAALATVAAFLILLLSDIVPLRRFGAVIAFAIAWCLVTSLTLMPALLYRLSGYSKEIQSDAEPEPQPDTA